MSAQNTEEFLRDVLPAGLYGDITPLGSAGGMMQARGAAIHAKARYMGGGGKAVHLKLILAADDAAGTATQDLRSPSRLQRLKRRLPGFTGAGIPIVPLVAVDDIAGVGLLVAMEDISPLSRFIEPRGTNPQLGLAVLRSLEPPRDADWVHFDICPGNIGLTAQGAPVFIDLESIYEAEAGGFEISYPALKRGRVAVNIMDRLRKCWADGGSIDRDAVRNKHCFELMLVAAECCIGPLPAPVNRNFDADTLDLWMAESAGAPKLKAFWRAELEAVLRSGRCAPGDEIASRLENILRSGDEGDSQVEPMDNDLHIVQTKGTPPVDADGAERRRLRRELRAGTLERAQLDRYISLLRNVTASADKTARDAWLELIYVYVCVFRSATAASAAVDDALVMFPGDAELLIERRLIGAWIAGKS